MEKIDIAFQNSKCYGVEKMEVNEGEKFTVHLTHPHDHFKWFADNDSVLQIEVSADTLSAQITAVEYGHSTLYIKEKHTGIFSNPFKRVIEFKIKVVDKTARTLGMEFSEAQEQPFAD